MEQKKSYYKSRWDYKKISPKIRCFIEDGFIIDLAKVLEDCDKKLKNLKISKGIKFIGCTFKENELPR